MAKKEDLLKQCRYYRSDSDTQPDGIKSMFWNAERMYIKIDGSDISADNVKFYLECGLAGASYDAPLELLACLFSVYCKGADNSPDTLAVYFRNNILPNYLAQPQYK